ncbi:MAG TPA: DUF1634 domain-containing protein [Gammaproteobacteria bacterium]|nr:DUF1634 domain-containing protein [Gammaproteobacteria bacterium]
MTASTQKTRQYMSHFMLFGTLTAMVFVLIGGALYLWQQANTPLQTELLITAKPMSLFGTIHDLHRATPIGLIELGLGLLIATQVLRMVWLVEMYVGERDYWFTGFSLFILTTILYSLFIMG